MIDDIGRNVSRRLQADSSGEAVPEVAAISPMRMFATVLWDRIRRLFGRSR